MRQPAVRAGTMAPVEKALRLRVARSRASLEAALFDEPPRASGRFPRSATFRLLADRRLMFATGLVASLLMRGAPAVGRRFAALAAALRMLHSRTRPPARGRVTLTRLHRPTETLSNTYAGDPK